MTPEDFDALAALVRERHEAAVRLQDPIADHDARKWCSDLANFCRARSANFDEAKFVSACGF